MCSSDDQLRSALAKALDIPEPFKRRLYVLGVITLALAEDSPKAAPILVGGGAVEFYSLGGYATHDMDVVVANRERLDEVLMQLGFVRGRGKRHWYNESIDIAVEAHDTVLAGSMDRVCVIDVEGLQVYVIGIEDLILDRLRAHVFWKSTADGEWAARLMTLHEPSVDWDYLSSEATREGITDALVALREAHTHDG